ncbi:MAG: DNA polymerase/3'-5' exonuclease PolX [Candidatus Omnitrophota bacterium]
MINTLIVRIFRGIAQILEIKGENRFRVRAYDRAAGNIESLAEDIQLLISEGRLNEIPGIGPDLSAKIKEIASTGKSGFFEELKRTIPPGMLDLLNIPSVGAKTAKLLFEQAGVRGIADLEAAIVKNKLQAISGIKERTIENIKRGIEVLKRGRERMSLAEADNVADSFVGVLKGLPEITLLSVGGSLRRRKETVRDIDILMVSDKPEKVMDAFVSLPQVKEILAQGKTKSSIRTSDDIQVDCRVVDGSSYGAALLYFTGSKNFNIKIRQLAIKKGLKINEYGVFKGERFIGGGTEAQIFSLLGLAYIEPELREDTGEIELAGKALLPRLIEEKDIIGDFHVHSHWSDGRDSVEQIIRACVRKGYSYVAITDHSGSLKIARGLDRAAVKKKKAQIKKANKGLKGFTVLFGAEVDIDSDGELDYGPETLREFDIVIAAVHTGFKQSKERLTRRIIKACQNKYVHIIAHPTGKLKGQRDPYDIDFVEICRVARETNTALEVNSFPDRLDLNDINCRYALEKGVRFSIDTDAHSLEHLDDMRYGVCVARRGWLRRKDVLNTLPLDKLLKGIKKSK